MLTMPDGFEPVGVWCGGQLLGHVAFFFGESLSFRGEIGEVVRYFLRLRFEARTIRSCKKCEQVLAQF